MLTVLTSCTTPVAQIKNSANDYWYYDTRFQERCPSMDSQTVCTELKEEAKLLQTWNSDLKENAAAAERGGKFPLQLKKLKDTETKFKAKAKGW